MFLLASLQKLFASDHIASAEVISAEQNLSEIIHLEIKITSNVPSRFTGSPEFTFPTGWMVLNSNLVAKKQLI
ncbi:MAG: hypothetical protein ACK40G_04390 [Cytophagaceae bacterium]